MAANNLRTVSAAGCEIAYQLERKKVKNINLRVRKDGSVYVSANRAVLVAYIDAFVASKAEFIVKAIERIAEKQAAAPQPKTYTDGESFGLLGEEYKLQVRKAAKTAVSVADKLICLDVKDIDNIEQKRRLVDDFFAKQCRIVFAEVLDELYPKFEQYGVKNPVLRIRNMKTRWGSCLVQKQVITLNKRLIEAPRACIEYVMMHELCHFLQADHSPRFYGFMDIFMPDWRSRKELLANSIKTLA